MLWSNSAAINTRVAATLCANQPHESADAAPKVRDAGPLGADLPHADDAGAAETRRMIKPRS